MTQKEKDAEALKLILHMFYQKTELSYKEMKTAIEEWYNGEENAFRGLKKAQIEETEEKFPHGNTNRVQP